MTAVQHDPGNAFASVVATPLAHLNRSREVLLIWPGQTTVIETSHKLSFENETAEDEAATDDSQPLAAPDAAEVTGGEAEPAEQPE